MMSANAAVVVPTALERAIRRAKWRLLPILLLMYLMAYLDRANIGYAKQAFQASTGVSDAAFAFGAGVFFIGYAVFEVPSNLLLHRFGARRWMARIMITWGLVSAAMVFARGDTSFSILRVLLGAAEAGFFPGAILYMTYWFPARARAEVMAVFYFGGPLALMIGGPLSGLLLDTGGLFGLSDWQTMFVVEGVMAMLVGASCLRLLTDRPAEARWMPEDERDALTSALAEEERRKSEHGRTSFGTVIRDPRLALFATIYFLIQVSGYGIAFYLPSQVSALLGIKVGFEVGLVTAIPWAVAIAVGLFWPALAMRTGLRRSFACLSLLGIVVGLVIASHAPPVVAIAALCLATSGIITAQPIFWTYPTAYLGGAAAAGGIAVVNAIGNLGGFAAPNLKNAAESLWSSSAAGAYVLAGSAALACLLFAGIGRSRVGAVARRPGEDGTPSPSQLEIVLGTAARLGANGVQDAH